MDLRKTICQNENCTSIKRKEELKMKCFKCGAQLEDDAKFCTVCGTSMEEVQTKQSEQNEAEELRKGENITGKQQNNIKKLGLIIGTLLIVVGIFRILSAGTSISSTSFGGDFYTYTYQGIVAVTEILARIEVSIGWLIVAVGAAIDVYSLNK